MAMSLTESQTESLSGRSIVAAVKRAGIRYVAAVPDLHTARGLLLPMGQDPELTVIRTCKEDECLGIAAGLSYGDRRTLILIQYTGFWYAMNAIRGVAVEQSLPICLMVGLLGHQPGSDLRQAKRAGLRAIIPTLEAFGLPYHLIESEPDVGKIAPAIEDAYRSMHPVVMLIGRSPAP
jgi:sulfopyruvate decarboxylase subunit alpha